MACTPLVCPRRVNKLEPLGEVHGLGSAQPEAENKANPEPNRGKSRRTAARGLGNVVAGGFPSRQRNQSCYLKLSYLPINRVETLQVVTSGADSARHWLVCQALYAYSTITGALRKGAGNIDNKNIVWRNKAPRHIYAITRQLQPRTPST